MWKTQSVENGSVENQECGKRGVWKMQSVENAEFRKMRSVENADVSRFYRENVRMYPVFKEFRSIVNIVDSQ